MRVRQSGADTRVRDTLIRAIDKIDIALFTFSRNAREVSALFSDSDISELGSSNLDFYYI